MAYQARVTIKDVAKKAGISTQTVSRVINERPDVAEETRQRVLVTIDELGYQRSELARSLIQQRSYTLGVVTAGLRFVGGPGRALSGITRACESLGYMIILKEILRFNAGNVQPLLQSLLGRQVDGILWAVPEIGDNHAWINERLTNINTPVVFMSMAKRPDIPIVAFDNYLGGKMAVQHLIDSGRRQIGHLAGPLDWWEARERERAWRETLTANGLPAAARQTVTGNWSPQSGAAAFRQLLDSYPEMDAVFVANDEMALAVLQAACESGLKVPDDLAVIGFDDLAESAYFCPPLTTIRQDQSELGERAIHELINRVEAYNDGIVPPDPLSVILTPELVLRGSA